MFVHNELWDEVGDFRFHADLDLYEVVTGILRTASPGSLFSGYIIVRNRRWFEDILKVRISKTKYANLKCTKKPKSIFMWALIITLIILNIDFAAIV